ncbi:MAG: cobyric acid synthase, partial [SAR202 cluster bacterium]|nr:cobyric acid synthase [SAR202 cluster bacterium]
MSAKFVMVQGTGSSVGKSVLVTALCRIFAQDGYRTAPFKSQNMSLNAGVTPDGKEMGRAQIVQAEAAGVAPTVEMNPILLKPEADHRSQLVVMGRPDGNLASKDYASRRTRLWGTVTSALDTLRSQYDVVVIEGAGSPAEINLRKGDIVNMEIALHLNSPVLLVGDIDKGGVFASLYGTVALVSEPERELVKGIIINKFRGDISLLNPGLPQLEELTGVPVLGVVPYFTDIYVPEEDAAQEARTVMSSNQQARALDVAVVTLPHISNFDDFDPIARESGVNLRYARFPSQLGTPDLLIIPGTKTTADDLAYLRSTGFAQEIVRLANTGTSVIGVCGGFQMLGARILDPDRLESQIAESDGLGLVGVETRFSDDKQTSLIEGEVTEARGLLEGALGCRFEAYEIHMGQTVPIGTGNLRVDPALSVRVRSGKNSDGVIGYLSEDGWTLGTYTHGMFNDTRLRRAIL